MRKILGLNTEFENLEYDGFHENPFSTSISLLDYDAVVIDVGFLAENCYGESSSTYQNKTLLSNRNSPQIVEDFSVIKEQIVELLKQGRNLFLLMGKNESCYIYTGEKQYSGTGKNARQTNIVREFDTYSFLPITIKATHVYGSEISICGNSPYRDFLKQTADSSQYASYFSIREQSTALAQIKGTDKIIAAVIPYEKGKIICLPQPFYEDEYLESKYWEECGRKYLDSLFELDERLNISNEDFSLPKWANEMYILGEKEEIAKQIKIENKIGELQVKLINQKHCIEEIQKYKLLLTASGGLLEEITKKVLGELGFSLLNAEKGRSDIIAKYGDLGIVAEIKGVSKSAAEKHAAQLEKWVSQYIEENENAPKALLIVNGFCDIPVAERTEDVFPHQMLKYCEARGHALIATTQLLCLYIETQRDPACKDDRINELLSCVGKYERYHDVFEYFDLKDTHK